MIHFDERSNEEAFAEPVLQVGEDSGRVRADQEQPSGHDIHHDPWLAPACPALQTLAANIFADIECNSPRPSRQRADATERRRSIVDNLTTNLTLIVLHYPVEGTRMAIPARNDPTTRYDRPRFPREVVTKLTVAMEALGLLIRYPGRRGRERTTIGPSQHFRALVAPLALRPDSIGRAEGAETIILKASTGRGRTKLLIDYEDTAETLAMRAEMERINAYLGEADIRLGTKAPPVRPFLTRRFQIEHPEAPHTFDQHGRLYGGFWINLPKAERHLLKIGGEELVDLDFTGMFSQLAYREAGLALPNSDPYGGIEGLPRSVAKLALSAMLCRSGPMLRLPSALRQPLGKDWNAARLTAALSERHPGIASMFGTGIGLKLMFTESRILMATLRNLLNQSIPALPMHDGLMAPASKEEAAKKAMIWASTAIVGTALPIVKKLFPPSDISMIANESAMLIRSTSLLAR